MPGAVFLKQPDEALAPAFGFPGVVTAVVTMAVEPRGQVPGPLLQATAQIRDGRLHARLTGGTDGERYLVTASADVGDETLQDELEVVVFDATWAMPDGGAPMLSITDFVRRFGLEEVVRMTEAEHAPGRIDRDLLTGALVDAQAEVEASLASRFALPLAEVPIVVEAIVADLARVRLYPKGAPEGVATAGKAALARLDKIAAGKLSVGLATPAPAESETPIAVAPGRRAYPDFLSSY